MNTTSEEILSLIINLEYLLKNSDSLKFDIKLKVLHIIKNGEKTTPNDIIDKLGMARSNLAIKEGKYSLIDAQDLKTLEMLKHCVYLDKDLVLPCKIKSSDNTYHFNTETVVTKDNVLAYASYGFQEDKTRNVNHNVLITKQGKGLKQALSKNKIKQNQGGK